MFRNEEDAMKRNRRQRKTSSEPYRIRAEDETKIYTEGTEKMNAF